MSATNHNLLAKSCGRLTMAEVRYASGVLSPMLRHRQNSLGISLQAHLHVKVSLQLDAHAQVHVKTYIKGKNHE